MATLGMKSQTWMLILAALAGVVFAERIRTLPFGNKLPTF